MFAACSDNSTSTDSKSTRNGDLGFVEMTVTGDFDTELSGSAFFEMDSDQSVGGHTYQLTFMDGFDGPQSFAAYITRFRSDAFDQPETGTYKIDGRLHNFSAGYDHFRGVQTNVESYMDSYCPDVIEQGGVLEIERSSKTEVTGSFLFVVAGFDDLSDCNLLGYLEVEGDFLAVPLEWSFDY
jgi:hypothetical protein